jgi:hypothetical protein
MLKENSPKMFYYKHFFKQLCVGFFCATLTVSQLMTPEQLESIKAIEVSNSKKQIEHFGQWGLIHNCLH